MEQLHSSRICVKNLPRYITVDRLKDYFSRKGEVTDAKLIHTSDGKTRQLGFIGYRTEHEAEEAIRYFNRSYLDTSRITCEFAYKIGDPNIPRPWSRHSKTNKNEKKVSETKGFKGSEKEKKNAGKEIDVNDPELKEFLKVVQPRVKSNFWGDHGSMAPVPDQNGRVGEKQTPTRSKGEEEKSVASDKGCDEDDKSQRPAHDDVISDMDYFKSRVKKNWSDYDDDDDDKHGNNSSLNETLKEKDVNNAGESIDQEEKELLDTNRLFVKNFPYTVTEEELEELFGQFGKVSQVHLVVNKDTRISKGIAYILYSLPEFAARALEELDNSIFQGRVLQVTQAKQKTSMKLGTNGMESEGPKTFKQKREEERKEREACGDTRAWNALFIRPDSVAENVARKYGVSKADFLDPEADDLPARHAMAETQVIAETKKAFKNAGVNIKSLEDFAAGRTEGLKRSKHILLVKNLPYGSSESELASMFGKFGSLDKIILPPTKTLALVVFLESTGARMAFNRLAYKRYKDAPLYLEWAPANVLTQTLTTESNERTSSAVVGENDVKRAIQDQNLDGAADADADPDRVESRSLYIKNLNFKTTGESLKKHLVELMKKGTILSVKIVMHKKHGKDVSSGYGFVEFDSMETATSVCKDFQGTVLEGHPLFLAVCQTKKNEQEIKKKKSNTSSTKLLVRNVDFKAVVEDLRQLFSPFGQIKSLRLPSKVYGGHKGFAFVEYVTKQEAQNALEALSSTHLYGRRLVLDRANEGETLEELRARTAAQFGEEENGFQNPTTVSKKRKGMPVLDERNMKFERYAY